jgi:hypothetical protein
VRRVVVIILALLAAAGLALLLLGACGITYGRETEACCARCRYPVAGLVNNVCPECGSGLAGAGTRKAGARVLLRPPLWVAITCRTLLVAIPAFIFLWMEWEASPRRVSVATVKATSAAGNFKTFNVQGRGVVYDDNFTFTPSPRKKTTAVIAGPVRTVRLYALDAAVRVRYDAGEGQQVRTADAMSVEDVLAWMKAAGIDVSTASAQAEAAEIAIIIRNVVVGGVHQSTRPRRASSGGRAVAAERFTLQFKVNRAVGAWTVRPWVVAIILGGALACWLGTVMPLLAPVRIWRGGAVAG